MNDLDPIQFDEDLRAFLNGNFRPNGTRYGSMHGHRAMTRLPRTSRRRCHCGCRTRATHTGLGDGLALMSGCEAIVTQWVEDPDIAIWHLRHPWTPS